MGVKARTHDLPHFSEELSMSMQETQNKPLV